MEKEVSHGVLRDGTTLLSKNNVVWDDTGIRSLRNNFNSTFYYREGTNSFTVDLREQITSEVQYYSHPYGVVNDSKIDESDLQYKTKSFGNDADRMMSGAHKTAAYKPRYQRQVRPRRDQASIFITIMLLFSAILDVTTGVKIHVDTPVIVFMPSAEAILFCNVTYTEEEKKDPVIIRWERDHRDGPSVIWRQSDGSDFPALRYNNSVRFGDGCSLIIRNPNSEYSGIYTVTVDVYFEVSKSVELFIFNSTVKKYFTGERRISVTSETDILGSMQSTSEMKALIMAGIVILCGAMVTVSVLLVALFTKKGKCLIRPCPNFQESKVKDQDENDPERATVPLHHNPSTQGN